MKYSALVFVLLFTSCVSITHGESFENVFKDNAGEVRECYSKRLAQKPSLEGTLNVELAVEYAGEVQTLHFIEDSSTIKDAPLRKCIHDKAVKWKFPAPRAEQTVMLSYPYSFEAKGGVVRLGQDAQPN